MAPGSGGVVDAMIDADNPIDEEYQEPPHPPGSVAIHWRSGRSQTVPLPSSRLYPLTLPRRYMLRELSRR